MGNRVEVCLNITIYHPCAAPQTIGHNASDGVFDRPIATIAKACIGHCGIQKFVQDHRNRSLKDAIGYAWDS